MNHLAPIETHDINLLFSYKYWTSAKIGRLELSENFQLYLPKYDYIMLSPMTQKREQWTLWFWVELVFEWYEDSVAFHIFIFTFLFRSNDEKYTLMRTISVTVMLIISKVPFWKLLDISYIQSIFSTITRHNDNCIWKNLEDLTAYLYDPYDSYDQLGQIPWNENETKKEPWKLLVAQKSEFVLWKILHQDISLIIMFFFLSQTNVVFVFNLVLIE